MKSTIESLLTQQASRSPKKVAASLSKETSEAVPWWN